MPHLSGPITPWGPLINVLVGVSGPRAAALQRANQQLPQQITAKLVVDTGATGTALDITILQQLQIPPTGDTVQRTGSVTLSPSVQLILPAAMIPGLIAALTSQYENFTRMTAAAGTHGENQAKS